MLMQGPFENERLRYLTEAGPAFQWFYFMIFYILYLLSTLFTWTHHSEQCSLALDNVLKQQVKKLRL